MFRERSDQAESAFGNYLILGFIRKIDNFFNDLISPVLALHAAKDAAFASTGARTPKVDLRLK